MQRMDTRGLLASALTRGRYGAKKTGKTIAFRCPRHSDSHASAWLGDAAWGCSACGFTEPLATLAEVLGVEVPTEQKGLTLAEYAERKGLRMETLRQAGVEERVGKYGDAVVAIPYRNATGAVIRTKVRTRNGTFWERDGEGVPLYGQDVLAQADPSVPVLIVEGESDCHAGWQRGLCVVGLAGASQWRPEYAPLLKGRTVYVWQEPDEGGATLTGAIAQDLPKAYVIREVYHQGDIVKDLCDLHQRITTDEDFHTAWREILRNATPIGAESPAMVFDAISGNTLVQLLTEKLAPIDATPTPLPLWNSLCHGGGGGVGIARGWMVTIGANTGTGKSLIGLNLAAEATRHGEVVTFVSLEMARNELATRYLSIVSGEPILELEQGGKFSVETYKRAAATVDGIREQTGGYITVNRRPMSRLTDIVSVIRHHAETNGSRFFVVDYLQLAWVANTTNIHDRIEMVSHQLRELSQSLNVTMVSLSQFNRETSKSRVDRPVSQGLMGGSAVENDSHQVLLLDHSRMERNTYAMDTWLLMDKNRNGGLADIPIRWDYRSLRLLPRVPTVSDEEDTHGRLSRAGRM